MTPRIAFGLCIVLAAVIGGLGLGSVLHERDTLRTQVADQAARITAMDGARDQAADNAQKAAQAESARLQRDAARASHFEQLQQDTRRYENDPGRAVRGSADPEFVRIWREANAGPKH